MKGFRLWFRDHQALLVGRGQRGPTSPDTTHAALPPMEPGGTALGWRRGGGTLPWGELAAPRYRSLHTLHALQTPAKGQGRLLENSKTRRATPTFTVQKCRGTCSPDRHPVLPRAATVPARSPAYAAARWVFRGKPPKVALRGWDESGQIPLDQ